MHIVFAASECAPFAKTGGLADVVGALPPMLVRLGHRVTTFLPYYRQVAKMVSSPRVVLQSLTIPFEYYNRFVRVLDGGVRSGVQIYFIDCQELFDRENFYGTPSGDYADNAERFGLFGRAVIEASKALGVPDVFHLHDWQSTAVSMLMRSTYYFDPMLRGVPTVLTVHNAGYQGSFAAQTIQKLLLPWDMYTADKVEHKDAFNFLKGGLVYADAITTVSPTYAEEIKTTEFGCGLEATFQRRAGEMYGILNGVDYGEWDPATDGHIAAHYTADDLSGKKECRRDLLHAYGLQGVPEETPVLGIITRFATQKGIDILAQIVDQLVQEDIRLIVHGTGEEYFERLFQEIGNRYPEKVRVHVDYDNTLAHKIEAGSDIFLMPSRYEPCGLNQIYSLRYGTVPVVRATGGLADTIDELPDGGGNGFKFSSYESQDFLSAIQRALAAFRNKEQWKAMMLRGMAQNFSWEQPAQEYVRVYERAIAARN